MAVVEAASADGLDIIAIRESHPLVTEHTFDNIRRRMSVIYEFEGKRKAAAKGSALPNIV